MAHRPTDAELEEARNDPDKARRGFLVLKGADFASESGIVYFLEEAYKVIADYEVSGFKELYRRLVRNALSKFNLRYRIDDPFTLCVLLPGSFTNLYGELHRLNTGNPDLIVLWSDFERAFDQFARTHSDSDLRMSITRTSNYLEGLASATNGKAGTLGRLCDHLSDWPHYKVKEAVKSLYGFCNDYPGIRHAGTPKNRIRQLATRDSVAINVSLMALAIYLSKGLDQGVVMGIGPSPAARPRLNLPTQQSVSGRGQGIFRRLLMTLGLQHR